MTTKRKKTDPWDRQKNETSKNYSYFTKYLNLKENRSLEKCRQSVGEMSVSKRQLERICSNWNWVERAEQYDEDQAIKDRKRNEKKGQKIKNREIDNTDIRLQVINENLKDLHVAREDPKTRSTSISHALESNCSAHKGTLEELYMLLGIPTKVNQNYNETKLDANLTNIEDVTTNEVLEKLKQKDLAK